MSERDPSIFPKMEIVSNPFKKIGRFICDRLYSDTPNTGAADMIDRMLYDLPPYVPQPKQLELWNETSN